MPRTFAKKPCRFCKHWFRPDPRKGDRQYACSAPECQLVRQIGNEESRLDRDPGYFRGRGAKQEAYRAAKRGKKPAQRKAATHPKDRDHVVHKVIALELAGSQGVAGEVTHHDVHKVIRAQTAILVGLVTQLTGHDVHKETDFDLVALHDRGRRVLSGGGRRHGKARPG